MASMGSLAHYMQELSGAGFGIRDFLHEGNGDIWLAALNGPARYVGWMLIEERAEGGDMLFQRAASDPGFLAGFERVCAGGGVALYRNRDAGSRAVASVRLRQSRASEPNLEHRLVSEAAEIELVADEADVERQVGVGPLVTHLAANQEVVADRSAQAAEHQPTLPSSRWPDHPPGTER